MSVDSYAVANFFQRRMPRDRTRHLSLTTKEFARPKTNVTPVRYLRNASRFCLYEKIKRVESISPVYRRKTFFLLLSFSPIRRSTVRSCSIYVLSNIRITKNRMHRKRLLVIAFYRYSNHPYTKLHRTAEFNTLWLNRISGNANE